MENNHFNYIVPLPSDKDCEDILLSTFLNDGNAFNEAESLLNEDCFCNEQNRAVFAAIKSLHDQGDMADFITITAETKKMGHEIPPTYLLDLAEKDNTLDCRQYAAHLAECLERRKLISMGQKTISMAIDNTMDVNAVIQHVQNGINHSLDFADNRVKDAKEVAGEVFADLNDKINGKTAAAMPTGFEKIDRHGGLREGNLIVLAAESSQGKTSFADAIALNTAKRGTPVAFYSLEMTRKQIMMRLLSMESRVPQTQIDCGTLSSSDMQRIDRSINIVNRLPLYFDDKGTTSLEAICASIRSLHVKKGIRGVVIDYLQVLPQNRRDFNEEAALADAARTLKNLAKQLGIWILLLSQLSRDSKSCVPNLNRLRGSGQINEAADLTILLYRPEYYHTCYPAPYKQVEPHNTALVNIAKNRNGECFSFICGFCPELTKFYDLKEIPKLSDQISSENFDFEKSLRA